MSKFRHEKKSSYSLSTTKNSMVCKFRRLWKRLAAVCVKWGLAPFTLFSILWKRKGLLNPVGETKSVKNEVAQGGAITNSQVAALPPSKPSNISAPIYSPGSLVNEAANVEIEDYDWQFTIRELQLRMQRTRLVSLTSEEVIKVAQELIPYQKVNNLEELIEVVTAEVENLDKLSKLNKRLRKYKKFDPAETWASRWIACQIAYLFPEERREEWLGDLYEVNREMLHKGYPRWIVNLNNLGKTVILVLSALKIKLSDLFSIGFAKR